MDQLKVLELRLESTVSDPGTPFFSAALHLHMHCQDTASSLSLGRVGWLGKSCALGPGW